MLLIGGVAFVCVLAAVVLGWQLLRPPAEPSPPQAAATPLAPTPAQIVAQAKTLEEILTAAKAYREKGDWNNALPLYIAAAERGSGPARITLGRLYDPNGFQAGQPFSKPNPRQAAKFYAEAEEADAPDAKALRAALKQWLEARAKDGDNEAAMTLKDYWK